MKNYIYQIDTYCSLKFPLCLLLLFCLFACDSYLEVDDPFGQISESSVFKNEALATAALTTIYSKLRDDVLLTGNPSGISVLMGLYSDELDYYGDPGLSIEDFYLHQIMASNSTVESLWNNTYNLIYRANAVIEGTENSINISQNSKDQIIGEALFIRGMMHFYLVSLFGNIPYIKTTDYLVNSQVPRMSETEVYESIIEDLVQAKSLLGTSYVGGERIRPNQSVVSSLLARVYLYKESWSLAEQESNNVINNTGLFELEQNLENEFLKESTSAIWQFKPKSEGFNTNEASTFIFTSVPPPFLALNPDLVNSMEASDLRKINWVKEVSDGGASWFHANKYKESQNTGISMEYSIIFRLSEQYLIRSESRAMQGDIIGALEDLNEIRNRAGLNDVVVQNLEEFRQILLKERRIELFTEFGLRWFDIKRMGFADEILAPIKPGWSINDLFLPIPESEILVNPNLNPQNPGY